MVNLGAGLLRRLPVGSSLSKSVANNDGRVRSQMPGLIAAVTVLVALFLTPLFHSLPEAALVAVVLIAIGGMPRVKEIRRL